MLKDQLIRTMGGIRLNHQQQIKLAWLAARRNVSQEQALSDIVEAYLGNAVPQFSPASRAKLEQELAAIATKSGKQLSDVKADILNNKTHRYHLTDEEAKSYRDYLTLTGQ